MNALLHAITAGPTTARAALTQVVHVTTAAGSGPPKCDFDRGFRAALVEINEALRAAVMQRPRHTFVRRPTHPTVVYAVEWDGTNLADVRDIVAAHAPRVCPEVEEMDVDGVPVPVLCLYRDDDPDPVDELLPGWVVLVSADGTVDVMFGADFHEAFDRP